MVKVQEITDEETAAKYRRLVEIDEAIAELKSEKSDIETELGTAQTQKFAVVASVGRFERYRTSAKVTYDDDALRAQVVQVARGTVATDDGEIIEDPVERAVFVLNKTARMEWRVGDPELRTGLAAFGIEADQYREKVGGILKVKLVPSEVN